MNLKQIKILSVILIFFISFLAHFVYNYFPNLLISIFFPVNESIFEHMKILFTSILLYGFIEYFLLIKNNINFNNFKFQLFFTAFISIPIYLIIYLPIRYFCKENFIVSIGLMLFVYVIVEIISYYILKEKEYRFVNDLSIPLIILCYLIFGYLTYFPFENYLFYDFLENKYSISDYRLNF